MVDGGEPLAPQPAPEPVFGDRADETEAEQDDDREGDEQDRLVDREGFEGKAAEYGARQRFVEHLALLVRMRCWAGLAHPAAA